MSPGGADHPGADHGHVVSAGGGGAGGVTHRVHHHLLQHPGLVTATGQGAPARDQGGHIIMGQTWVRQTHGGHRGGEGQGLGQLDHRHVIVNGSETGLL